MKQKLFENVNGNRFKLITESVDGTDAKVKLVREGLKKVFSGGNDNISYTFVHGVGLGYIRDVSEAKKCAMTEARILAKECGYMEDEATQKFVKENDFSKLDAQDPTSALAKRSPEEDMAHSEESREVQIGEKILLCTSLLKKYIRPEAGTGTNACIRTIEEMAQELVQMHRQ